jgi:hypothetical protein
MRRRPGSVVLLAVAISGCAEGVTDPPGDEPGGPITTFSGAAASGCATPRPKTVLIDPTHDGGTWWFPQKGSTPEEFKPAEPHQGRAFAEYLRARGYTVTELGRGATMSPDSMMTYSVIVRAGYYYDARHPGYSTADLDAYANYTACPRTLVLLAEFMRDGRTDDLANHFGIALDGNITGMIDELTAHPVTDGVTSLPYIAGSYLSSETNPAVQVLGRAAGKAVLGLLTGRAAKVLFIGDVNGLQSMPQPFVANLVAWGF